MALNLTPEDIKAVVDAVKDELGGQPVDVKAHEVDDEIQEVFDTEPDEFLAKVMVETKDLSLAERRRIRKARAIEAEDQVVLNSGWKATSWRRTAFALRNNRR